LATLNPADIAKGVGMRAAKNWIKGLNDPNRIVKNMFRVVEKTRTKLTPAVQDAEFKVMPELGVQKLLAGPEAKAPQLRLGENVSTTGKGRGLLEASPKYGEGFERNTPKEAQQRMKEFAFKYWNPSKKKIDIPEGQAFNDKEKTILKKMGINPITGEYKSKPLQSAFQKAYERFKGKMKDESRSNVLKGSAVIAGAGLLAAGKSAEASDYTPAFKENPRKSKVPEALAIRAIAGEGEGESYEGMVALAEAIRNRGNLKGVYGLNAKRVKNGKVSKETYAKIKKAWKESETSNLLEGGMEWGNDDDVKIRYKNPKFDKEFEKVTKIGGHTFFKKRNK
jgi:hypothetical protein